jgi:ParB-like chromosome segregation protein Spo0J
MAAVFDTEKAPSVQRVDSFMIDPREVRLKPEFNGRQVLPPIDDLLEGFLDVGQIQDCLISRDGGIPVLEAGHRRWRCAIELTKRGKGPFDGVFKLRCKYFKGSELDLFIATVQENSDRVETKPIDDAHNITKFLRLGLSEEEIARRVYRKKTPEGAPDVRWVQDRAALIELSAESVEALNDGTIKNVSAAVALAKLSKTAQKDAVKHSKDSGKKLTAASLKKTDSDDTTAVKKLTTAAWSEFWTPYSERPDSAMTRLAAAYLKATAEGNVDLYFKALVKELK